MMQSIRKNLINKISAYYKENYLPFVRLIPTARFGLYIVAKIFFSPGDKIILSPITCRTVIHSLLAAKLIPVFVDIEIESGNIDVTKISKKLLNSAKGILTTNLYGNPDSAAEIRKIADTNDLMMVEDCAHVINSAAGKMRIGSIGDVSIFSFKKYFNEPGGMVCSGNELMAKKINKAVEDKTGYPTEKEEVLRLIQYYMSKSMFSPFESTISALFRKIRGTNNQIEPEQFQKNNHGEQKSPLAELNSSDSDFRRMPTVDSLMRTKGILDSLDDFISELTYRNQDLINHCPLLYKKSPFTEEVCHFVVPFFSENRDAIISKMNDKSIDTWFLYHPPMSKLFQDKIPCDYPLNLELIQEWSQNILPINSKFKEEYIEVIKSEAT